MNELAVGLKKNFYLFRQLDWFIRFFIEKGKFKGKMPLFSITSNKCSFRRISHHEPLVLN